MQHDLSVFSSIITVFWLACIAAFRTASHLAAHAPAHRYIANQHVITAHVTVRVVLSPDHAVQGGHKSSYCDDAIGAALTRHPHAASAGNAIIIGKQPLSPHLHRCSWQPASAVSFDAFSEDEAATRVTCDARGLAQIRVSVDRKQNSSSSTALCITSRDYHQLLLPIFWGEKKLRRCLRHWELSNEALALVFHPIFNFFSCAGAPTIPPMARWFHML